MASPFEIVLAPWRLELGEECVQALARLIDGVGVPAGALRHGVEIVGRAGKHP